MYYFTQLHCQKDLFYNADDVHTYLTHIIPKCEESECRTQFLVTRKSDEDLIEVRSQKHPYLERITDNRISGLTTQVEIPNQKRFAFEIRLAAEKHHREHAYNTKGQKTVCDSVSLKDIDTWVLTKFQQKNLQIEKDNYHIILEPEVEIETHHGHLIKIHAIKCTGVCIGDPTEALYTGMGPNKAYGFGMLVLQTI